MRPFALLVVVFAFAATTANPAIAQGQSNAPGAATDIRYARHYPRTGYVLSGAFGDHEKRCRTICNSVDSIAGETVPFADGVKVWIDRAADQAWQVVYRFGKLVVLMAFVFSADGVFPEIRTVFCDWEIQKFSGMTLNELLTRGWAWPIGPKDGALLMGSA